MNIKDVDLNLLVVFHTIYETKSISAAAAQLDLSQPGMSHALKRLRNQLNDKLFVRKGNGVEPTVYAEGIAEPIRNAISFLEVSLGPSQSFDPATSTRHFRILLAGYLEPVLMPAVLQETYENPNITFEIVSPQSVLVEDAILDGTVDVVAYLQADMMHEISVEVLTPVAPILTYRLGHPITQEPNPLASIGKYRMIAPNFKPGAVKNLNKAKISQDISRDYLCLVNDVRSIPALLDGSDCVAFIPKHFAIHAAPLYGLGYFQTPQNVMKQDVTLSWHRNKDNDPAIAWLRQKFKDSIAQADAKAKSLLG